MCVCLDVEFLLNVGDWPLVKKEVWGDGRVPVFSWCGSEDSFDLVLPQWDVTRSSVLGNSDSQPDLLAAKVRDIDEAACKPAPCALLFIGGALNRRNPTAG